MVRNGYGTKMIFTMVRNGRYEITVIRGGWGAEEFRRAPMMHQKVPMLGKTNYTINLNTCEILLRDKKKTEVLPVTTSK
jgi:hypothetical protein